MFPKEVFASQFTSFDQVDTYPLKEEYSKWMLIIFKPWRDEQGTLKVDGMFSTALELYMWNEKNPRRICLEILRRKLRFVTDHSEDVLCNSNLAHSPSEEGGRRNKGHELCFDLNDKKVDASDPDIDGDLVEHHFEKLNGGDEEVDWSEGYDKKYESWLE
eukprot:5878636-Ditylum_brightwellii.AAC.1